MSLNLSPIRRVARTIEKLIEQRKHNASEPSLEILSLIQMYFDDFDESWSTVQQQQHLDELVHKIESKLENTPMSTIYVKDDLNKAFDRVTRSIEECTSMNLDEMNVLTLALCDVRHAVDKILTNVFDQLNVLNSKMSAMECEINTLKMQSSLIMKVNFMADLFEPFVVKLNEKLSQLHILPYQFYTKDNLEKIRKQFFSKNSDDRDEQMVAMVEIIEGLASDYKVQPNIAIDYLLKKKVRNEATHFNRRIQDYVMTNRLGPISLHSFLSINPDLEREFFSIEVDSLDGLFVQMKPFVFTEVVDQWKKRSVYMLPKVPL